MTGPAELQIYKGPLIDPVSAHFLGFLNSIVFLNSSRALSYNGLAPKDPFY